MKSGCGNLLPTEKFLKNIAYGDFRGEKYRNNSFTWINPYKISPNGYKRVLTKIYKATERKPVNMD